MVVPVCCTCAQLALMNNQGRPLETAGGSDRGLYLSLILAATAE